MYTHKINASVESHGNLVIFFEYLLKRLPNSGKERGYCPSLRKIVEFDFSEILGSEVISKELV